MRVVVAPDSFGGMLDPVEAARAIADGWLSDRPGDDVVTVPMSDGGEGLLEAVAAGLPGTRRHEREVVGPLGLPVVAAFLTLADGRAVVETAQACGLRLVPSDRRDPRRTTTWGVGELLVAAAASAGSQDLLIGLGGSATVDGGAGALSGLGLRVMVEDGGGLKIGGEDLPRVAAIARGWLDPHVAAAPARVLADVTTPLAEAAGVFGPQKGADPDTVAHLRRGLDRLADVVERDLTASSLRHVAGTGAAGGLGFALSALFGVQPEPGAAALADLVGLDAALAEADVVITGEGRVDPASFQGKVVGTVVDRVARHAPDARRVLVAGQDALDQTVLREHGVAPRDLVLGPAAEPREAAAALATAVAAFARSL